MSEPALKGENNAIFQQNYTLTMFITFKMAYSCCFSLGENLDFPDFFQKSLITSTTDCDFQKPILAQNQILNEMKQVKV